MSKKEKLKKTKSKKKKKQKKEKSSIEKDSLVINHKIELKLAKKMDFLRLDKYVKKGNKNVKSWKMEFGIPYWLYNSKGKIENKNYILSDSTDLTDFSDYLNRNQVLILINPFD